MDDLLITAMLVLWVVDGVVLFHLIGYNASQIWRNGGTKFLEAFDGTARAGALGTLLCFAGIAYGLFFYVDDVAGHCVAAGAALAGLLMLRRACMSTWDAVLKDPGEGPILESDAPIEDPSQATPTMRNVAARLAGLLRNVDTSVPLVIAITGEWGSGKTSLMRMVTREVSAAGCPCVWFNAWHHQRETHLFASLMETVRNEVERWPFGRYLEVRRDLSLMRIRRAKLRFLAVLGAFVIFFLFGVESIISSTSVAWPGLGALVLAGYAMLDGYRSFLKVFGVPPASLLAGSATWFGWRAFSDKLSFRHRFGSAFGEVCQAFGVRRLVVCIDDLDRCGPEQVVTILEAVNFLTASGDCVVLLGMEEARVKAAIELHCVDKIRPGEKNRQSYSDRYLAKLIGLNVVVPRVTKQELTAVRG